MIDSIDDKIRKNTFSDIWLTLRKKKNDQRIKIMIVYYSIIDLTKPYVTEALHLEFDSFDDG